MKRELKLLTSDPPPGISCWMVDNRIDHLQASKWCTYRGLLLYYAYYIAKRRTERKLKMPLKCKMSMIKTLLEKY